MTISYNIDFLDRYLAPGISVFTTCDAPDISEQHLEAPHWLANHFLNSVVRGAYKNKFRQYAANQIYRAQVVFADYHDAMCLTAEYLRSGRPDNPAIRAYFRALARWESCLRNLQLFIDVMNKMKKDLGDEPVFKKNDGTPEQRAYCIANTVKHFGLDISGERHAKEDTVPMWLTNSGFKTRSHELTYHEMARLVSGVANAGVSYRIPYHSRSQMRNPSVNPDAFGTPVMSSVRRERKERDEQ